MKILKLIEKIMIILIICLIGFAGVYLPWDNNLGMTNKLKDFSMGKDFTGYREIILELSDANKVLDSDNKVVGDTDAYDDSSIESNSYKKSDEKVNSEENLNVENYEKAKSIIEKRLNELDVQEYNLSMDKQSGKIYIQVPENSKTDKIVSNITESGSIELKDSEDDTKVLLSSDSFKNAKVLYSTTTSGTAVYLNLQFNNEGKKILKDLSENEYKKIEEKSEESSDEDSSENNDTEKDEENSDASETKDDESKSESKEDKKESEDDESESESEEESDTKQKQVTLYISDNSVVTTSFEETVTNGEIGLRIGQVSEEAKDIEETSLSAKTIAATLNGGVMPLKYKVTDNKYIQSEYNINTLKKVMIVVSCIFDILLVYMIIRFKAKGILLVCNYLGFVALYTIILRLFNVTVTMESILGGIIVLSLNYIINLKLIKVCKDEKMYYKNYLDIIMKLLPAFAISIIFIFLPVLSLSSIGMAMFWGISLILAYNITITRAITD